MRVDGREKRPLQYSRNKTEAAYRVGGGGAPAAYVVTPGPSCDHN